MKCPVCKEEMEKGVINIQNRWHVEGTIAHKIESLLGQGPFIYAYRCPKCGKVELQSEIK